MKKKITFYHFLSVLVMISAFFACTTRTEQPESIHYGPIEMVYELPNVAGTIYYVAPDGDVLSDGVNLNAPTTIEAAIARVVTGDAIVMRGGTYRTGDLTFNQGITIQPYGDEKPVLKGTLVATDWEQAGDNLWYTNWDYLFPAGPESWWRRDRNEEFTPMHRFNNDGIFVDGQYLQSVVNTEQVDAETYFVDYDNNRIYIGTNPANRLIEITAFRKAIFRTTGEAHGKLSDGRGPVIRGLDIRQYPDTMVHIDGYYPQGMSAEHEHGKDVIGTVLENNTFSNCFRIGVFAIGDSLVMRNNLVYDTNTEGVYIVASSDVLLERNIFKNNNIEKWTGFYPAAVKIFNQTYRVVCRENLIIDHPNSNGLWYDVGNIDGVFVNNWIENVGSPDGDFRDDQVWPSSNGFFFEISKGVICAGNVFVNNNQGLLILNSSDAKIYNNTFINSRASFGRDERGDNPDHFGWHPDTGPGVDERDGHVFVNNLCVFDKDYGFPMLYVWQRSHLCERLNVPQIQEIDYNIYVKKVASENGSTILWSPFNNEKCQTWIHDPSELTAIYPQFEVNSKLFVSYDGPIFMDEANGDLRLSSDFKAYQAGTQLPADILKAMEIKDGKAAFVGAYSK